MNPNIFIFADAVYNNDPNSWYTYLPGTKSVNFGNSYDMITNISTLTHDLIINQPLNSTNIISYGFSDSNRPEYLFYYQTPYFQAIIAAYITCCMPTNKFKYANELTQSGTWSVPEMTNVLYSGTNYNNILICNTISASLEYNFTDIKYCAIAFCENPNENNAFWNIYINNVLESSHTRTFALSSPSSKAVTIVLIIDCGTVGNYNIKVSSTDTTTKAIFWFCGWNLNDAKTLGKPTLVCSIPRVDVSLLTPTTTFKNIIYNERAMSDCVSDLQSMGLPITYFNWSTPDGLFNNVNYKPSQLKYKRMAFDLMQYALI